MRIRLLCTRLGWCGSDRPGNTDEQRLLDVRELRGAKRDALIGLEQGCGGCDLSDDTGQLERLGRRGGSLWHLIAKPEQPRTVAPQVG